MKSHRSSIFILFITIRDLRTNRMSLNDDGLYKKDGFNHKYSAKAFFVNALSVLKRFLNFTFNSSKANVTSVGLTLILFKIKTKVQFVHS